MRTTFEASLKMNNCIAINLDGSATIRFDSDCQQLAKVLTMLGGRTGSRLYLTLTATDEGADGFPDPQSTDDFQSIERDSDGE